MQLIVRMASRGLVFLALVLAAGCSSRITNLTPSVMPREKSGLYHFEGQWTSTQRSRELRQQDIRGYVVVDNKFYPMERVPLMANRWESEVPIPDTHRPIFYYFKWDYGTAGFGRDHPNSIRSELYRLEIADSLQ